MTPTLLIVDDHEGFRAFARDLLGAEGFEIAGDAADGEAALQSAQELHPDVVLLDIQLPGIDGIEVAERLATTTPRPLVVLTSTRSAADFGTRLENAPVRGFIPKHELSPAAVAALVGPPS